MKKITYEEMLNKIDLYEADLKSMFENNQSN